VQALCVLWGRATGEGPFSHLLRVKKKEGETHEGFGKEFGEYSGNWGRAGRLFGDAMTMDKISPGQRSNAAALHITGSCLTADSCALEKV